MGFNWPDTVVERPLVTKIEEKNLLFQGRLQKRRGRDNYVHGVQAPLSFYAQGTEVEHNKHLQPAQLVPKFAVVATDNGQKDCNGRLFYAGM